MKLSRIIFSIALSVALLFGAASTVSAASDSKDSKKSDKNSSQTASTTTTASASGAGVQAYGSDSALQIGTIVQLANKDATKVKPATQADLGHMYGVTVDPHKLSVTISSTGSTNEVYVATSGTYNVLVSTQGGSIKAGDYVTLSSVEGVAMKADSEQKTVFGRAAAGFDSKSNGIGKVELKDTAGKSTGTATLGVIPVAIDVRHNPNDKSTKANVPQFLQRLGQAIAEKPVGPLRIYLSIFITGLSIVIALVILYSGVRNSIFSIGRNPLSKKAIFRGLFEIILTSIIILIIGLFAVYLLLKL